VRETAAEYFKNAADCRDLAAKLSDRQDKQLLIRMALSWERVASLPRPAPLRGVAEKRKRRRLQQLTDARVGAGR
jgi:hypothetical protein